MKNQPLTRFILSTEAQNNFGRLLDDVSVNGTRYVIKRFGMPKAVIVPLEDFERLLQDDSDARYTLQVLRESRTEYHLGESIGREGG